MKAKDHTSSHTYVEPRNFCKAQRRLPCQSLYSRQRVNTQVKIEFGARAAPDRLLAYLDRLTCPVDMSVYQIDVGPDQHERANTISEFGAWTWTYTANLKTQYPIAARTECIFTPHFTSNAVPGF